jgi:hypothetical protein
MNVSLNEQGAGEVVDSVRFSSDGAQLLSRENTVMSLRVLQKAGNFLRN